MYVELHTSSAFSFLEGASLPEALVERAAALGYRALALLDRDNVSGIPRFHLAAKRAGVRALVGAELTMRAGGEQPAVAGRDLHGRNGPLRQQERPGAPGDRRTAAAATRATRHAASGTARATAPASGAVWSPHPPSLWRLPVLVASREGYRNLCRLITRLKLGAPKGEGALRLDELEGATQGLIALVGRAALSATHYGVGGLLDRVIGVFGRSRTFVEINRHRLRDQESDNQALIALASAFRVPIVATGGVRFATEDERPLFDVLTCLRHQTTITRAGRRLSWNAERYLQAPEAMAERFADLPQALAATIDLADRLEYTMADLGYRFPNYPVPDGETQASFLRKITEVGARDRYRPYHDRARAQIHRELHLIEKLDLAGYFLIVWDIVNFCRQRGILVQGRGSAANSAVCYSLGITAVDPVGMELLFERFLSEERGEWPDIDLDLPSGDRREEAIQYVYQRYGARGAAMTANVITYRGRSAAREVGKVLEMDEASIDRMAKGIRPFEWQDPYETIAGHLSDAGLDPTDPKMRLFGDLWRRIQDLPRHLGQHSGGMVICQGRLDEIVPLEPATMPGRVVVQWDKDDCADMGLVKVDLLGLGMMAVLQDAITIVNRSTRDAVPPAAGSRPVDRQHSSVRIGVAGVTTADLAPQEHGEAAGASTRGASGCAPTDAASCAGGEPFDLAHLPPDDPIVYRMLQEADTIGIFQVESRAQMATLPRLRPRTFYDLVVEVAIIRPGPIVGQMVHPYLSRRNGREPLSYPHPSLEPILARTLGVPLFQEQLLRMAMVVAGFSGGEAEELRRAMGFKRSEARMRRIEEKLRAGMARNGITDDAAEDIVRSITSFALYGFPESHAASFALLVYASAYLKAYYPAAFYTALLNNQPMGFYHPATLVKDAQRRGVRFASIDVQRSGWDCRVEADGAIRLGLRYVRGLRREVAAAMEGTGDRSVEPPVDASGGGFGRSDGDSDPGVGRPVDAAESPRARRADAGPAHSGSGDARTTFPICPKCGADDESMLERIEEPHAGARWFCNVCAFDWIETPSAAVEHVVPAAAEESRNAARLSWRDTTAQARDRAARPVDVSGADDAPRRAAAVDSARPAAGSADHGERPGDRRRFRSLEHFVAATGIRRDELVTLAEIGALNSFGYDRRSALWQIERAVRPAGALFDGDETRDPRNGAPPHAADHRGADAHQAVDPSPAVPPAADAANAPVSPLTPMTLAERVIADYAGTGLTIGPHPMALRRQEMALRGVLRAVDLPKGPSGRRVRVAGAVITRQRPGTAKGFVFLTLEDETGIANVIVRPDVFVEQRAVIVHEPFVMVEGILQQQDGVTSVRAERMLPLGGQAPRVESHDFH